MNVRELGTNHLHFPPAVIVRRSAARRLAMLAAGAVLALGLAACGRESHPTTADTEGIYVNAGPLTYQVQLSRELNPFNAGDREYLVGVSSPPLKPDEEWFAVFMYAVNKTHTDHTTTNAFDIVDTIGNKYYPVSINTAINPFAWTPQTLKPLGTEPALDTAASFVPPQGSLLLFKLNTSIYSNRPLTLQIYAAGQSHPSTVSLDL
jgi:hypothetical protein